MLEGGTRPPTGAAVTDNPDQAVIDTDGDELKASLLASLRMAVLRAKLDANEIESVGVALKAGWITPEYAVAWLLDIGLITQVIPEEPAP
jgi:hypothetical protein